MLNSRHVNMGTRTKLERWLRTELFAQNLVVRRFTPVKLLGSSLLCSFGYKRTCAQGARLATRVTYMYLFVHVQYMTYGVQVAINL